MAATLLAISKSFFAQDVQTSRVGLFGYISVAYKRYSVQGFLLLLYHKLHNRKPSPRKASLVARTRKKLKQLIRLLSILPPLIRKMILMRICRSVIRKVVSGSTRKQMNTTCEIGSVCPPTNTTVCSSISASGLAGFTTCTRIKWAAFLAMTWVLVKQSKLPLYARVSLTLDKYGRS